LVRGLSENLFYAARTNDPGLVMYTLSLDPAIDPDYRDQSGNTALHYAAIAGAADAARALLAAGAHPDIRNKEGKTPLDKAQEQERAAVVQLLKGAHGAQPAIPTLPPIKLPELNTIPAPKVVPSYTAFDIERLIKDQKYEDEPERMAFKGDPYFVEEMPTQFEEAFGYSRPEIFRPFTPPGLPERRPEQYELSPTFEDFNRFPKNFSKPTKKMEIQKMRAAASRIAASEDDDPEEEGMCYSVLPPLQWITIEDAKMAVMQLIDSLEQQNQQFKESLLAQADNLARIEDNKDLEQDRLIKLYTALGKERSAKITALKKQYHALMLQVNNRFGQDGIDEIVGLLITVPQKPQESNNKGSTMLLSLRGSKKKVDENHDRLQREINALDAQLRAIKAKRDQKQSEYVAVGKKMYTLKQKFDQNVIATPAAEDQNDMHSQWVDEQEQAEGNLLQVQESDEKSAQLVSLYLKKTEFMEELFALDAIIDDIDQATHNGSEQELARLEKRLKKHIQHYHHELPSGIDRDEILAILMLLVRSVSLEQCLLRAPVRAKHAAPTLHNRLAQEQLHLQLVIPWLQNSLERAERATNTKDRAQNVKNRAFNLSIARTALYFLQAVELDRQTAKTSKGLIARIKMRRGVIEKALSSKTGLQHETYEALLRWIDSMLLAWPQLKRNPQRMITQKDSAIMTEIKKVRWKRLLEELPRIEW